MNGRLKASPYIFLTRAPLFWAGNFVFGRPLSEALPPFSINLIHWVLACTILIPLTLALEGRFLRPARYLWPSLVTMGITGFFCSTLLSISPSSTRRVPTPHSSTAPRPY